MLLCAGHLDSTPELKDQTLHIRIAGVDAPEVSLELGILQR
jgi:hypothetical protein